MAALKRARWRSKPQKSGPYTATVARKPKADDPGRSYWRVTFRPRGQEKKAAHFADGSPASGYYTRSEARQVLVRLNREVPNPVAEAERDALVVVRLIRDLVPAFLGVSVGHYVLGTAIGIIPGSLVYASVGDGVGAVLEAGRDVDLGIIFEPRFLLPIVGLGVLALLPVLYKKFRARRAPAAD